MFAQDVVDILEAKKQNWWKDMQQTIPASLIRFGKSRW